MVECGGLENRFLPFGGTWVQIPTSPLKFSDKGNFNGTQESVKRRDKRRSDRSAYQFIWIFSVICAGNCCESLLGKIKLIFLQRGEAVFNFK